MRVDIERPIGYIARENINIIGYLMRLIVSLFILVSFVIVIGHGTAGAASPITLQSPGTFSTITDPSKMTIIKRTTQSSWPWYLTRSAGLVAALLLVILILLGIGQITGHTYRFMEPLTAWKVHRAVAIAFGFSVVIHVFSLLFDKFEPYNIWQLLVPFDSKYQTVVLFGHHLGSFYTALGILAFYASVVIILSSLLWMQRKPKTWRLLHYTGYLLVCLVFIHGLFLGTDLLHGTLRVLWIGSGIIILIGIIFRLRRARTTN